MQFRREVIIVSPPDWFLDRSRDRERRGVQQDDGRLASSPAGCYTWPRRGRLTRFLAIECAADSRHAAPCDRSTMSPGRVRHLDERRVHHSMRSRGGPMRPAGDVLQQTAESCPTCDRPVVSPDRVVADEELVVASLVIAFVIDPAGQCDEEEPERSRERKHGGSVSEAPSSTIFAAESLETVNVSSNATLPRSRSNSWTLRR